MRKLRFLLFSIVISYLLTACLAESKVPEEGALPNVVLIFADDQTYSTIQALGNHEIETPNLDRLVRQGTTFTHAYNMGGWNGAICMASRAMMISGRSVWRVNEFRQHWLVGDSLDQTWGKLMEAQGYQTYMTGKWHVDAPADSVFQTARHVRPGMPGDAREAVPLGDPENGPVGYYRPKSENDDSWSPTDTTFGGYWEGGKHWSEVLKEDALSFIESAAVEDDPFFMYLAFNAPHDPRQSPQEFIDRYPLDGISLPESWMPEYPNQEAIGLGPKARDEALAPFPRTEYATKKHIQEYYAIITHLDQQIGEILDALEASGKMDNTYIFFTADHGLAIGRHGLLGKQNMYDHSLRVPLMITGPDIPQNQQVEVDVYLQDVMATSLELAGIDKPTYVEFNSILDLARGSAHQSHYDAIYGAFINYQRMIRKDSMKLIVYPQANELLLYNLATDPQEITNLADDPGHASQLIRLFNDLLELQKHYGDTLDLQPLYSQVQNQEQVN